MDCSIKGCGYGGLTVQFVGCCTGGLKVVIWMVL